MSVMDTLPPLPPMPQTERWAYSIDEFCKLVGISRQTFYNLQPEQRPQVVPVGRRFIVPADAIRAWLRDRAVQHG